MEKVFEPMTYEQFKEKMDYLLTILNNPNLNEETKQGINNSMQLLLVAFSNPIIYIPFDK